MVMFTQAFRYAYEPFIFAQAKSEGESQQRAYSDAMKYFVIFGLLIFLGVMFYLPILKHFVSSAYWSGLEVVPVMMLAELCFGIFFNLSLWYKLTDRTVWGMYFSLASFVLMLVLNLLMVPSIGIPYGYMGSAWAALISYFAVMAGSYFIGQHYYPIRYPLRDIGLYIVIAAAMWAIGTYLFNFDNMPWLRYLLRTILLCIYILAICRRENLPFISRRFRPKSSE